MSYKLERLAPQAQYSDTESFYFFTADLIRTKQDAINAAKMIAGIANTQGAYTDDVNASNYIWLHDEIANHWGEQWFNMDAFEGVEIQLQEAFEKNACGRIFFALTLTRSLLFAAQKINSNN